MHWEYTMSEGALLKNNETQGLMIHRGKGRWERYAESTDWREGTRLTAEEAKAEQSRFDFHMANS